MSDCERPSRRKVLSRIVATTSLVAGGASVQASSTPSDQDNRVFHVEILNSPDEVVAGSSVTIKARITNDSNETQSGVVSIKGSGNTKSITLGPGQSQTVRLQKETFESQGGDSEAFEVEIGKASAGTRVRLLTPADFQPELSGVPETLPLGHEAQAQAVIENEGEATAGKPVFIEYEEQGPFASGFKKTKKSISISGKSSTSFNVPIDSTLFGKGHMFIRIRTPDGISLQSVQVVPAEPPKFEAEITSISANREDEPVSVSATFTNVGDTQGSKEATARIEGTEHSDTATVSADYGKDTSHTFEIPTDRGDSGEQTVIVETEIDSASQQVTIDPNAFYTVQVTNTNAPIPKGFPLEMTVAVENIGGGKNSKDVTVFAQNPEENTKITSKTLEIEPGVTEEIDFELDTSNTDLSGGVIIQTDYESASITPNIGNVDFFSISDVTITNDPTTAGEEVSIEFTIENQGDTTGTQDITANIESLGGNTTSLTIPQSNSKSTNINVSSSLDSVGEYNVSLSTEDDIQNTTVVIEEPQPPEDTGNTNSSSNENETQNQDTNENTNANDGNEQSNNDNTDDSDGPGFGIATAVGSLLSAGYLLKKRVTE